MNNSDYSIEVKDLTKKFGDFTAVNNINFQIKKGEVFGFLGPNGSGKTTTIRMLIGLMDVTSGSATVAGYDVKKQSEQIKRVIGYMSQKFSLYDDLTVEENIDFYGGIYKVPKQHRKEREERIIQMAGIQEFRSSLTKTLSGGWKQRLALGCAIIHEPKIIFLDEPTSGVDPIARNNFWQLIKDMAREGVTVFVTTHYMDEAENCDRLALIYKGAIIATGAPNDLKIQCMQEDVLKITVPDSQEWIERLKKLDFIKEVALFGVALHAIVTDGRRATLALSALFSGAGVKDVKIEKIQASLEDVFVSMIESYDSAGGVCEPQKS